MILQSSLDVKSPHIFLRGGNTFDPLGLFSEQIFGNVKDYQCQCGKFSGIKFSGKRCDECNVLIGPSTIRSYTTSKIILPLKIPNPLYCMYSLPTHLLTQLKKSKDDFVIEKVIEYLEKKAEDKKINIMIDSVLVLPPTIRNVRRINKKNIEIDKINYFYISILNYIQKYKDSCIGEDPKNLEIFTKLHLTRTCIKLYTYIIHLLTKKEGMIRQSVLGKRNDFTGRAVITVDPTLPIDSVKIPYQILVGLFFPKILHRMNNDFDNVDSYFYLKKYMYNPETCPIQVIQKIESIIDEIQKYNYVLLNRQPTLHRVSIQGFKPIGTKNEAISLPPEVCAAFNADFDGDTMAVYVPLSEKAKEEVKTKMLSPFQLLVPGSLSFKGFSHDFVLGAYYATKEVRDNEPIIITYENEHILEKLHPHTRVKVDDYITSAGRLYISELLQCEDITSPLNASKIKKLLNNLFFKLLYHPKSDIYNLADIIYKFRRYVVNFSTQYTLSILDFMPNTTSLDENKKLFKNLKWDNENINKLNECIKEQIASLELTDNIKQIISSGARGNMKQLMQTVGLRGFVRNTVGKLVTPPILSSLKEGYTPIEIILSSTGNRKGAIDKALNTATSGYLTRKLIFSLQHLLLAENDCGTMEGLKVKLTKENINSYFFRYTTSNQLIHPLKIDDFINKEVKIRSPLFCKSKKGICKKCYQLNCFLESDKIGIIAAQSIGEPGTQMVMRTFHTGGAAEIKTLELPSGYFYSDENDIYYSATNLILDIDSDFEELPIKENILQDSISFYVGTNDSEGEVFILPRGTILLIDLKNLGTLIKKGTALFKYTIEVTDLATDLHLVDKNLSTNILTTYENSFELLNTLKDIYNQYHPILSVYFEILWSERLRFANDYTRLVRYEENLSPDTQVILLSLSSIPHFRLLLSLCFEDFRKFFKGFLKEPTLTYSPLECLIQSDISMLRELNQEE